MFFINVRAKVPRLEEDQIGRNYKEIEENDDRTYIWGPLSIKVEDVDKVWGQSLNRSVILMYSGDLILVAEPHQELYSRIENMLKEREEAGIESNPSCEQEEETEEDETLDGGDS